MRLPLGNQRRVSCIIGERNKQRMQPNFSLHVFLKEFVFFGERLYFFRCFDVVFYIYRKSLIFSDCDLFSRKKATCNIRFICIRKPSGSCVQLNRKAFLSNTNLKQQNQYGICQFEKVSFFLIGAIVIYTQHYHIYISSSSNYEII